MPETFALSFTFVNLMTTCPLPLAVAANCWTSAMFFPPASLKMSKLLSTCVPLIDTLNSRWPAALQ